MFGIVHRGMSRGLSMIFNHCARHCCKFHFALAFAMIFVARKREKDRICQIFMQDYDFAGGRCRLCSSIIQQV
jgi:hypothetical protein